ncbi:MAG: hypothetical protein QS748_01925 [Candidatus Endonucleobacter bathymodioli]|uniref:Uncharacterized protein n=1 Tax=Candidatus Endonucleibacter bathymodioli TaxID=539814 RepID=A0AA90SWU2_9GAMM|nr:hypothetical protein [Candidatus Endonucleobacter bathymodioli]
MTISVAFSQEMHLYPKAFDENIAVIEPHILGKTREIYCESESVYGECVFNFEMYSINTNSGYSSYMKMLGGYGAYLHNWANATTGTKTQARLDQIQCELDDYHKNSSNDKMIFKHDVTKKCYALISNVASSMVRDNYLKRHIVYHIPKMNKWLDIKSDPSISSYLFCVDHSKIIIDEIKDRKEADNKVDLQHLSVYTALYMKEPVAVAMLESKGHNYHIKYMVTYPYAQLDDRKSSVVQGAEEALLNFIIREVKRKKNIKQVIITHHICKDGDLLKKGWELEGIIAQIDVLTNTDEDLTNTEEGIINIEEDLINQIDLLRNTKKPKDRRRKKHFNFCGLFK